MTIQVDLSTLRARVGIAPGDTTRDAELQAALEAAGTLMETYCDRYFMQSGQTETFTHIETNVLSLKRYPVNTINSIVDENGQAITAYHVDSKAGLVQLDAFTVRHQVTVSYEGGYDPLPDDLVLVALSLFDKVFAMQGGGGAAVAAGGIKTIRAGDLSVTYDTGAQAATGGSGGGAFGGLIDPMSKAILDLYMRRKT